MDAMTTPEMTPPQALEILNQMVSRAPGNRQDHVVAMQAVQVLLGVLDESVPLPAPSSPRLIQGFDADTASG